MAKKMRERYPLSFDDILSECQSALLRASTTFNPSLGWAFSTYACNAMIRAVYRLAHGKRRQPCQLDDSKGDFILPAVEADVDLGVSETELHHAVEALPDADREVICLRFGLFGVPQCTLEEAGRRIGVCKERIRQIQNRALAALRIACQEALN